MEHLLFDPRGSGMDPRRASQEPSRPSVRRGAALALAVAAILGAGAAPAQTSRTTWYVLVLIFPSTSAPVAQVNGQNPPDLTPDQVKTIYAAVNNFQSDVSEWSGGLGAVDVEVRVVPDSSVKTLTAGCSGYYPEPTDVKDYLEAYTNIGLYDSVIAVWNNGNAPANNCTDLFIWTLPSSPALFTWSTVVGTDVGSYTGQSPGELFVHEWLHAVGFVYRSLGYSVPDADDACLSAWVNPVVDYCPIPNPGGTAQAFYRAVLQGTLIDQLTQTYTGISKSVWESGTTRPATRPNPLPVQLDSPFDNSCNLTPTLGWTPFPGYYGYQVTVSDGSDPTQTFTLTPGQNSTATIPPDLLAPDKLYKWTVQSLAVAGGVPSVVGDVLHFDTSSAVATPTFSLPGGPLPAGGYDVSISTSTPDASIRYTLDGTVPTQTSTAIPSGGAVTVMPGQTLNAIAFATSTCAVDSAVATATYTSVQPLIVKNTNDSGSETLRQALIDANATPGRDVIAFAIPGSGVQTITPKSPLPTVTDPVIIDGTSQPGYAGTPLIELDGSAAGLGSGLAITAGQSVVRGLAIHGFFNNGIELDGGSLNTIQGCYIGTNAAGTAALPNGNDGIYVNGSAHNTIGGDDLASSNVISGNHTGGVEIDFAASMENLVLGNRIGTDVTGKVMIPNGFRGVGVSGAADNQIGGTTPGAGNLISGNGYSGNDGDGISIADAGATGNVVLGNIIGLDASGTTALGNSRDGVLISYTVGSSPAVGASGNTIGGTQAGARNVISGNGDTGVAIVSATSGGDSNIVQGNLIGTNASGSAAVGNVKSGVGISGSAPGSPTPSDNLIGGITAEARNVISGNGLDGVAIIGASLKGNSVQGNYIGIDATGSFPLGNARSGVRLTTASPTISDSAANNMIGGAGGAGNVISGNGQAGVAIIGNTTGASGNVIAGNFIGLDASGTLALGNGAEGVLVTTTPFGGAAHDNTIGGTGGGGNWIGSNVQAGVQIEGAATHNAIYGNSIGVGLSGQALGNQGGGVVLNAPGNAVGSLGFAPNVIENNTGNGVGVTSGSGNSILSNSITANTGLGIDLAGGNPGVAAPTLTAAQTTGTATTVQATLQEAPNTSYQVQYFANAACDPSGAGQGATYLGTELLTTDANGQANATAATPSPLAVGTVVTATTTDGSGSTSAFSACVSVTASAMVGSGTPLVPWVKSNCPYTYDPLQTDTGGIGFGSPPDGIGDACQCGDVNGDGRVTIVDALIIERSLLQPPTAALAKPQLCDVNGDGKCDVVDALIILRALLDPPTATIKQACAPALPPP